MPRQKNVNAIKCERSAVGKAELLGELLSKHAKSFAVVFP